MTVDLEHGSFIVKTCRSWPLLVQFLLSCFLWTFCICIPKEICGPQVKNYFYR